MIVVGLPSTRTTRPRTCESALKRYSNNRHVSTSTLRSARKRIRFLRPALHSSVIEDDVQVGELSSQAARALKNRSGIRHIEDDMPHSGVGATDPFQSFAAAGADNDLVAEFVERFRKTLSNSRAAAGNEDCVRAHSHTRALRAHFDCFCAPIARQILTDAGESPLCDTFQGASFDSFGNRLILQCAELPNAFTGIAIDGFNNVYLANWITPNHNQGLRP